MTKTNPNQAHGTEAPQIPEYLKELAQACPKTVALALEVSGGQSNNEVNIVKAISLLGPIEMALQSQNDLTVNDLTRFRKLAKTAAGYNEATLLVTEMIRRTVGTNTDKADYCYTILSILKLNAYTVTLLTKKYTSGYSFLDTLTLLQRDQQFQEDLGINEYRLTQLHEELIKTNNIIRTVYDSRLTLTKCLELVQQEFVKVQEAKEKNGRENYIIDSIDLIIETIRISVRRLNKLDLMNAQELVNTFRGTILDTDND